MLRSRVSFFAWSPSLIKTSSQFTDDVVWDNPSHTDSENSCRVKLMWWWVFRLFRDRQDHQFVSLFPKRINTRMGQDSGIDENVDQLTQFREKCAHHAEKFKEVLEECNARVGKKKSTLETCHQEMVDYVHALDHCVSYRVVSAKLPMNCKNYSLFLFQAMVKAFKSLK